MNQNTGRLRLVSRREIELRALELLDFYRREYGLGVFAGERLYTPWSLVFTQSHIESDKLGLVLKSMLLERYYAPIIVVIGDRGVRYIIDGHHRAIVYTWLRMNVPGLTLIIPRYKPRMEKTILDVEFINPPDTPEDLTCWRHVVNVIRFFEKQYSALARVWLEDVEINKLRPTQPPVKERRAIKPPFECPPLVYRHGSEYFVIDGHNRVCTLLDLGVSKVKTLVFTINDIELGILRTARLLKYTGFTREYCSTV